ncbi:GNAT family N-acetyltransferase [Vibrio mexicanus]|uniref:GNAT family N-acetyltransferase n=1 Tax=Vibrio mexicanus TaxID=1004326 RepID=UPI00063C0532|nr:GNAT family N-acetyltransferase [Vibrio mexicanus]
MTHPKSQIRLLKKGDAQALLDFEYKNKRWFESKIGPRENDFYSIDGVKLHILETLTHYHAKATLPLVIINCGAIVGRINLHNLDVEKRRAHIGYRIDQDMIGQGLATKAVEHIVEYALKHFGIRHFIALAAVDNPASQKVLLNNQFSYARKHTAFARVKGKVLDCNEYIKVLQPQHID